MVTGTSVWVIFTLISNLIKHEELILNFTFFFNKFAYQAQDSNIFIYILISMLFLHVFFSFEYSVVKTANDCRIVLCCFSNYLSPFLSWVGRSGSISKSWPTWFWVLINLTWKIKIKNEMSFVHGALLTTWFSPTSILVSD